MQTAALRYHTGVQCSFMNAPLHAQGEPDVAIKMVYPNRSYYEWTYVNSQTLADDVEQSIEAILTHVCHSGPFDGLLGFSQGAAMATRIAKLQSDGDARFLNCKFKYVMLIGGVNPLGLTSEVR